MGSSERARRAAIRLAVCVGVALTWVLVGAQTNVSLQPTASPAAGQPGVHTITLTGSGFPAGTIAPANVTVQVAPATAGAGPSATTVASTVTTVTGSTRRVTFQVPAALVVSTPAAYRVSINGTTSAGVAFASTNSSALTINPPPAVSAIAPASAAPGQSLSVALTGEFTNFVQGSTRARFGADIAVGGAAADSLGPVTVMSATTATAQIVIAATAAPGPRSVTVATGVQQATRAAAFTIVIPNRTPTAQAGGPYSGTAGTPVAFNATGSSDPDGDALTFTWNFGDNGAPVAGASPTHVYATAGTFTVTLTVNDGRGGTATATTTATIVTANRPPTANAGGPYSGTAGTPVAFNATGSSDPDGDALTLTWDFGDNSTPVAGASPTHVYGTAGAFTVTLTVNDGRGGTATATTAATIVTANRPPTANAGGPYSGAIGAPIAFDASASSDPDGDPLTFAWTFGDGGAGATGATPTHAYTTSGQFVATVAVSDGRGGVATSTATVTVQTPTPTFSAAITTPPAGQVLAATPVVVRGTTSDATARVAVDDVQATTTGLTFEATVPLVEGPNEIRVQARNSRGEQVALSRRVILDTVPPAITLTGAADRSLTTTALLPVTGQVIDATPTTCDVGGQPLVVSNESFTGTTTLQPGSNELAIACRDAAGHVTRRTLIVFFDPQPLTVLSVSPSDGAAAVAPGASITVTFSEAVSVGSISTSTVFAAVQPAILIATRALSPDGRTVTLTPASPLPAGARVDVAVTTGVTDSTGVPLSSSFSSRFTTAGATVAPGALAGEAFDAARGLPLSAVLVEALAANGATVAQTATDERGRYLLRPGAPVTRLRFTRAGFTIVEREIVTSAAPLAEMLDARLTPMAAPQAVLALLGGSIRTTAGDVLEIPPGSFAADASVTITPIPEQGPRAVFPVGFRPIGIVQVDLPAPLSQAATLTMADRNGPGAHADATATFARYDPATLRWIATATAVVAPDGLSRVTGVTESQQLALLIADIGPDAPPAPVVGAPIAPAADVAIPGDATGAGVVTPSIGRADDPTPAAAQVTIAATTPLRSGTILRGDFVELFLLRNGGRLVPLGTSQDLVGYRAPGDPEGRSIAARFPIAPSQVLGPADLTAGTITVTLTRAPAARQTLVGPAGGGVQIADGSRVIAPPGALGADVALGLRRVDSDTHALDSPAGLTFVGALDVDLAGAASAASLELTLGGAASLAPTGSTVVVAQSRRIGGVDRWVFVALARVDGDGLTTVAAAGAVTLPGIRDGGRYAYFRFDGALAVIAGTARDAAGRRDGHLIDLETPLLASITGAAGQFALVSPPGAFTLLATRATEGDRVRVQGQTGVALAEILIGPTPPRLERLTVRLPRPEGNFAGPIVLLGKPAPVVDDDAAGQSSGDGDGVVEAGERIELRLTVRNEGSTAARHGALALRVRAAGVIVETSPATILIAELAPDAPSTVGPFVFQVPAGANAAALDYTLTYLTAGGVSNVIAFPLPLGVDHLRAPLGSEIVARFSEPVTLASLTAGFTLAEEQGATLVPVLTRVLGSEGGLVATLRPLAPLTQNARYRLTLADTIVDVDGRSLAEAPIVERVSTEDRTPPLPIESGRLELSVPDADGFVTITGTAGAVNPDDVVIALNETTGFNVLATVDTQGGFSARLRAELSDQITILLRDRNGNETRVSPGPFVRRNPITGVIESTVIGRAGGTVSGLGGLRLVVPAGALGGATELSLTRVTEPFALPADLAQEATVAAAFNAHFTVVDRVRIEGGSNRFRGPVRLALPAPSGAGVGDRFIVVRSRAVTIGGLLVDIDRLTGLTAAQNPVRTVDRLEILDSASVKNVNGSLELSTDSPPFTGILEPGVITVLEVTGPLLFLSGVVQQSPLIPTPVPDAIVRTERQSTATWPFSAVTDEEGRFVVADATLPGPFTPNAEVTTRLEVTDPGRLRTIRRTVRAVVQEDSPPNTNVAELVEPFYLTFPRSGGDGDDGGTDPITEILGDLEPPQVELVITGETLARGFARVGDTLTVTVIARDNDRVAFVGLEINQGAGFQPVALSPNHVFVIVPTAPGLLRFRAQARDAHDNVASAEARVLVTVDTVDGRTPLPDRPTTIEIERMQVAFDEHIVVPISEPLDPTTVNDQTVQLRDPEGARVDVELFLEGAGTVIRLAPRRYLRLGACYHLTLSTLIRDLAGQSFESGPISVSVKAPVQTTLVLDHTEDVALFEDNLLAVTHPPGVQEGDNGRLHVYRVRDAQGQLLPVPEERTTGDPVRTSGRPLSLAVQGDRAYVGNRFLGSIATKQPLVGTFVPTISPVAPDVFFGCLAGIDLTIICQGLYQLWADLPRPPSNIQVFDLSTPDEPTHVGAQVLNRVEPRLPNPFVASTEVWNPNTWPDRISVTDKGLAVLNFGHNVEFFVGGQQPQSIGVIGRIQGYGEINGRCQSGLNAGALCGGGPFAANDCTGSICAATTEYLDAAFFDSYALILESTGLRLVSTDDTSDPVANERLFDVEPLTGAFGGRVAAVTAFQWTDAAGAEHVSDLALVTTRDRRLHIYRTRELNGSSLSDPSLTDVRSVLDNVGGNISIDSCRGLAFVSGRDGEFHVIDFKNPDRPIELNAPGGGAAGFALNNLGSGFPLRGNVNDDGVVFVAGALGVGIVDLRAVPGGSCGGAPSLAPPQSANTSLEGRFVFEGAVAGAQARPINAVATDGASVATVTLRLDRASHMRLLTTPGATVALEISEVGRDDATCDIGGLLATPTSATPSRTLLVAPTGVQRLQGVVVAYYRPPPWFACSRDDRRRRTRRIRFEATVAGEASHVCARSSLLLERPPVLLVHGLNSSAEMWRSFPLLSPFARLDARDGISSELKSEVRVTFRDAQGRVEQTSTVPQYRFFAADYRSTNQSAIVGDDGGNRDRVRRQSEDMLRGLLARGVLASKFDVIAHSMGAPIVRAMHGDDQGPVRRFITLDGVHQGSMLADCLYENRDERFRFLTPEPPFCTETSLAAVTQFLPEGVAGLVATGLQQVVVNLVARFVPGLAEALEAAPFPDLVRSAFHNMVFMDLSRGAIRDLQTTAGPWPRMTSADVHTMVGVFDGDLQARVVTASLFEAVAKPLMLAVAEQLAEPFCTGVEFEPAFFRRPWPDYIYGYSLDGYFGLPIGIAGPHDVAVSSYSQAGGLQNDECSVFRSELPDPLVTPSPNGLTHVTCRAEVLEEAARFSPLGRKFGSKHLTGPIPGRAIYESQAVALKVGWLLDLGDPEHDELGGELPSYGGTFRRGFPFAGRETRGCSAP